MQYKVDINSIKKGMSIRDFIQKIQTLVSLLELSSSIVSEEDQILSIFNGLDDDYESFIETI